MDLTHTATAAQHAAESLTELHEGKLSNTGTGMSQVDQAYAGEVGAWAMILAARSRGWIVSDPEPNGMGYYHVTVWAKGPDDAALTPYGTPTEA